MKEGKTQQERLIEAHYSSTVENYSTKHFKNGKIPVEKENNSMEEGEINSNNIHTLSLFHNKVYTKQIVHI